MEQRNTRLRNAGFVTFFFSGICTISSGVVVSLLQEEYGFAYGMTGTLLSLLSIGNLLAGLLAGALVGKMGMKPSVLLLTIGYAVSSQKREERKKLQSVTASLALARPAMGVNRYTSQSTRPSAASASTASVVLTLAAAEIRKGQSRAPQA